MQVEEEGCKQGKTRGQREQRKRARYLVVIREGDDGAADAEDHRRVDLAVRVRVRIDLGNQVRENRG